VSLSERTPRAFFADDTHVHSATDVWTCGQKVVPAEADAGLWGILVIAAFVFPQEEGAMADRVDVTFSMSGRDLSFLAHAMNFISGGIANEDETMRGYWQVMFERALEGNFEDDDGETGQSRARLVPGYDEINATCSDMTDWRVPRIHRVIGYVCALGGNGEVLDKVAALDDHEGTLTVKWKAEPTDQEKTFFQRHGAA
jgi:hypothetical protein